jgi:hypothetical protein
MKKRIILSACVLTAGIVFTGCGASAGDEAVGDVALIEDNAADDGAYEEIINSLDAGQAYAYADIAGSDNKALLIASGAYDNGDGTMAAIDAEIYCKDKSGEVISYSYITSDGTAYPISEKDGFLYYGGNHHVAKIYIDISNEAVMTKEDAEEVFDTDGNATYYYFSLDEEFDGEVDDDSHLTQLFDEYGEADVIEFTVVE